MLNNYIVFDLFLHFAQYFFYVLFVVFIKVSLRLGRARIQMLTSDLSPNLSKGSRTCVPFRCVSHDGRRS